MDGRQGDPRGAGVEAVVAEQCTGRGRRGVVAAAAPTAAAIGAGVLRDGGNAYDAVVAALLAETVLLPPKCGLAGDLVALRVRAGAAAPDALLAIGGAPRRLGDAVAAAGALPDVGAMSVGVPGAPAGYAALAAAGTVPLERLAAPAIALARDGFPWAPVCTLLAQESAALVARENPGGTRYFPGGRVLRPGELVTLPGLASVLEELVERGGALFDGPVGEAVATVVAERGGVLARDDLALAVTAEWERAAHARSGEWDVWATPAPTHGATLLDAVAALDGRPVDAGALLRAISSALGRQRLSLADPLLAAGTSMVSAADSSGEAVVVIHSNSYPRFGSGLVVDEYDLILANRAGRGFTAEPGHPNFPLPGRRPATTLHAWAAGREGSAETLGGTPGGANQMPWNLQLLRDLFDGVGEPGRLVVAPRWEWDGRTARIEEGTADDDRRALAAAAETEQVPRWGLRCAQQVVLRPRAGEALVAAADPRTGGHASGA